MSFMKIGNLIRNITIPTAGYAQYEHSLFLFYLMEKLPVTQ